MGEASLAVDDELLDPFVNPANAVRLEGLHVVSAAMPVADPLSRSPSGCYFDHTLCSEGCIGHNKNSQLKHSQR